MRSSPESCSITLGICTLAEKLVMVTDRIEEHIPQYLSSGKQAELVDALRDFENRRYYMDRESAEVLQGDGWSGLEIVNFDDGRRDTIKGIVLSNSCDLDVENRRDVPPRLIFAPLVPVKAYVNALERAKISADRIEAKLDAIRRQRVSSIFFLPRDGALDADHIALLDDVHNLPFPRFKSEGRRAKLFTLNQMGFYLFVLKLSIHFCRFQEGIER